MTNTIIFNANNIPFPDESTASQVAVVLSRVVGNQYITTQYENGYVIVPGNQQSSFNEPSIGIEFKEIYLRPALRSQIPKIIKIGIGLLIAFLAETLMFSIGIETLQLRVYELLGTTFSLDLMISVVKGLALSLSAFWLLKLLYELYSRNYFIGPKGVEATYGIASKDQFRIEFKHIRGINLRQGIIERIIGFGTIEISTSGSDGSEISFRNIAKPSKVLSELRTRSKALA